MKAFIYERYGPPENLRMAEVDKPAPDGGEVVVRVLAASVAASPEADREGHAAHLRRAGEAINPMVIATKVANVRPEKHGRKASNSRCNDFGTSTVDTSHRS